jgi:hypothetical protein
MPFLSRSLLMTSLNSTAVQSMLSFLSAEAFMTHESDQAVQSMLPFLSQYKLL